VVVKGLPPARESIGWSGSPKQTDEIAQGYGWG